MRSDRTAERSKALPWWQVLEEELKAQGFGEGLKEKRESLWTQHVRGLWPSALALEIEARSFGDLDNPTARRLKRALRDKVLPPLPEKPEFDFHHYHEKVRDFVAAMDGALGPIVPISQGDPAGFVDPENEGEELRRKVQAFKKADGRPRHSEFTGALGGSGAAACGPPAPSISGPCFGLCGERVGDRIWSWLSPRCLCLRPGPNRVFRSRFPASEAS